MTSGLSSGTVLQNRYQIVRLLGQGGMGAVYLARDLRLDKLCAVKETLDVSPQAQQQFRREARWLARLDHAHLPRVTDYFAQTERYYLVMDYVEGSDLETLLRERGSIPPAQALDWADQVLDALDCLHRQSPPVIHRDVKPANIKIAPTTGQEAGGKAVLVDFGIAKEHVPGQQTKTGARAFTPGFAPLEQYSGGGQTDARTDVYGLGATLYYLLTGVPPLDSLDRAAGQRLPSLEKANPHARVSSGVEVVVNKALELRKQDRWSSAGEMRQALDLAARPIRQAPLVVEPALAPTKVVRPQRARSRQERRGLDSRTLLWALGIVAAVLVVILGLVALLGRDRNGPTGQVTPAEMIPVAVVSPRGTSTLAPTAVATSMPQPTATPTIAPTATPLSTSTPRPTVTRPRLTATRPRPTATVSPTKKPVPVPSHTPAPTLTPRPTSALKPTLTATTAPTPTRPPPTRIAEPTTAGQQFPAPTLLAPNDGQVFSENDEVILEWQPVGQLPADGYYVVTVAYTHQGDTWDDDKPWTKKTSWTMSEHRYLLDYSDDGQFRWSVRAMRQTGQNAEGKPTGKPLSPPSGERTVTWKAADGGGGGRQPVPTLAPP